MRSSPHKGYWLLSDFSDNTKTHKTGLAQPGYLSAILHLAPYRESGYQVCPMAARNRCHTSCLYWTGRGTWPSVQQARIERTRLLFADRGRFFSLLYADIATLQEKARAQKKIPCVRLNGTSDIMWEKISHPTMGRSIIDLCSSLQFYDYTKIYSRLGHTPPNYHLTFSHGAHHKESERLSLMALGHGHTVAVIFPGIGKKVPLPTEHWGYPVLDGDEHDLRFLDPKPVVIGLRYKHPNNPNKE